MRNLETIDINNIETYDDVIKTAAEIAFSMQGGAIRAENRPKNTPDVFIDFSGNIATLEIRVYPYGFSTEDDVRRIWLRDYDTKDELKGKLQELVELAKRLKEKENIIQ